MPKKVGKYPRALRELALQRMRTATNLSELAKELDVPRPLLYNWRRQWQLPPEEPAENALAGENRRLKALLAEKTLEIDFFKGALRKIEARRQNSKPTGETASTTESGS